MIAAVVVHFGEPELTLRCVSSILAGTKVPQRVLVMDNGDGGRRSSAALRGGLALEPRVSLRGRGENIGFASACNAAFEELLDLPGLVGVLLLNNDCVVEPDFVQAMVGALDSNLGIDMVAARMVEMERPEVVDSLGVVLYSCGIAANRKNEDEPLLGPCGGAALYSTRLLRDLRERTGQWFEPRFFCYAEDTDLAIRAHLLGYRAAYAANAVTRHAGSAASGGGDSDFVMYHGLRNSLSTLGRCAPAGFFLRFGGRLLVLQLMLLAKYVRAGRIRLLFCVWRDVLRELPHGLKMRARLRQAGVLRWRLLTDVVDRRFYQRDYLARQARRFMGHGE